MASRSLATSVGGLVLRSPLIAASGTVGSVWEWAEVADVRPYGAAVAKSVAPEAWQGRPVPRLAPTTTGMLNSVGIQNPGVTSWVDTMIPRIPKLRVPVWGSAVAGVADGFALVAKGLVSAGVTGVEVNLSCPNLEDGEMFSFRADRCHDVITAVKGAVDVPVGAKLSPNTPDIVGVAGACRDAGADFVVLTNTAFGFGLSLPDRRPLLSGGVGGYSGPGLKPLSLRCVYEVAKEFPDLGIVGCGGVSTGADVVEYLMAGASAVEIGTVHLAEPKAGIRITKELVELMERLGTESVTDLVGTVRPW